MSLRPKCTASTASCLFPPLSSSGVSPSVWSIRVSPSVAATIGAPHLSLCIVKGQTCVERSQQILGVFRVLEDATLPKESHNVVVLNEVFSRYMPAEVELCSDRSLQAASYAASVKLRLLEQAFCNRDVAARAALRQLRGHVVVEGGVCGIHLLGKCIPCKIVGLFPVEPTAGSKIFAAVTSETTVIIENVSYKPQMSPNVASMPLPPGLSETASALQSQIETSVMLALKDEDDATLSADGEFALLPHHFGRHILIEGTPESGKSTLLRWCRETIANIGQNKALNIHIHVFNEDKAAFDELNVATVQTSQRAPHVHAFFIDDADTVLELADDSIAEVVLFCVVYRFLKRFRNGLAQVFCTG